MYIPIYCTKLGIANKLRSRLNILPNQYSQAPYQANLPSYAVDDNLMDQVIQQKEEFLNLILNQIYELPLLNSHYILTDIVESLVIAELIKIHFTGSQVPTLGSDLSGYGGNTQQYAYGLIQMLTAGINIYLPGIPIAQPTGTGISPQPVILIGEKTRNYYQNRDLITNDYTYVNTNKAAKYKRNSLKDINFTNNEPYYETGVIW